MIQLPDQQHLPIITLVHVLSGCVGWTGVLAVPTGCARPLTLTSLPSSRPLVADQMAGSQSVHTQPLGSLGLRVRWFPFAPPGPPDALDGRTTTHKLLALGHYSDSAEVRDLGLCAVHPEYVEPHTVLPPVPLANALHEATCSLAPTHLLSHPTPEPPLQLWRLGCGGPAAPGAEQRAEPGGQLAPGEQLHGHQGTHRAGCGL